MNLRIEVILLEDELFELKAEVKIFMKDYIEI
jgi:hypothetical protein